MDQSSLPEVALLCSEKGSSPAACHLCFYCFVCACVIFYMCTDSVWITLDDATVEMVDPRNCPANHSRMLLAVGVPGIHADNTFHVPYPWPAPAAPTQEEGRHVGVRQRLRRRASRPPLPSMILCNAPSLRNKVGELQLNTSVWYEYWEACLLVITETWPERWTSTHLLPWTASLWCTPTDLLTRRRAKEEESGFTLNGAPNSPWGSPFVTRTLRYYLTIHPFYVPREYGNIVLCSAYIPPSGNGARAAITIADCVHRQLKRTPGAPCFVVVDFNHCKLKIALLGFEQYVNCNTRGTNILEKSYGNVNNAYAAMAKPPLGNLDHEVVHLIPTYKSLFKSTKPQVKTIHVWNNDGTLKGCFSCTDWSLFHNFDLEATDTITEYFKFCKDNVLTKKTITMYSNKKTYISREIKKCIVQKQNAFKSRDFVTMRNIQKELDMKIREAKMKEKEKFETYCSSSNIKKL